MPSAPATRSTEVLTNEVFGIPIIDNGISMTSFLLVKSPKIILEFATMPESSLIVPSSLK